MYATARKMASCVRSSRINRWITPAGVIHLLMRLLRTHDAIFRAVAYTPSRSRAAGPDGPLQASGVERVAALRVTLTVSRVARV
ncbi:hypothetical protein, partial [Clavibacter michiganensis]|uniref:hypothetical protein n=1 Tax=Clavibacter michiganensis TaxID=28447 RepID=UPI00292D651F